MRKVTLDTILVRARPGQRTRGWLVAGPLALPVALGRGGIRANKREGDGGTPRGTFRLRRVWWRPDRGTRPRTQLPLRPIGAGDGWCEDPRDRHYNQPVRLDADDPGDRLKRADHLYDSSSSWTTTPGRASPAAAALFSCISQGRGSPQPRVVLR